MSRPNVLFLMVDEQRYPPSYENENIQEFRRTQLKAQESLRSRGVELHRHYAGSVACVPSRATIMTGHYPRLHGVRVTDGAAKSARDADMYWLDPDTVPTMGDYFRAGGYRTYYRGKWHVSHADLLTSDSQEPLATNDANGVINELTTKYYEKAARLEGFGFSGWIGPDPHGTAQSNVGLVRDPITANQTVELLGQLDQDGDTTPWFMVCSFLNPHDIDLAGLLWRSWGYPTSDETVPRVPEPPTQREDLSTKPSCQQDYVDKYNDIFIAQPLLPAFRQQYYYLHKCVDQQIQRVLDRLNGSRFAENTIIVFTSDHGDMLGAHGGMHQKWHSMYEEAIHVPAIFAGAGLPKGTAVRTPSSHVDLLPTLLALAGLNASELTQHLAESHTEARPLVGRDLSQALSGNPVNDQPVYFLTEDEVSEGLDQTNVRGKTYEAVKDPSNVEAVIARLEPGGPLYKFARYYSASLIGEFPGASRDDDDDSAPDEFELYNLDADPFEQNNLAGKRSSRNVQNALNALLLELRQERAVTPQNRNISQ